MSACAEVAYALTFWERFWERLLIGGAEACGDEREIGYAFDTFLFDRERGYTIGEIDGSSGILVAMEVCQESGGEDIARARRIDLLNWVAGEVGSRAVLEESSAVAAIGGHKK